MEQKILKLYYVPETSGRLILPQFIQQVCDGPEHLTLLLSFWMMLLLLVSGCTLRSIFLEDENIQSNVFSLVVCSQVGTIIVYMRSYYFFVMLCTPLGILVVQMVRNLPQLRPVQSQLRKRNVYPLQCSFQEFMNEGATQQGTVHGVTRVEHD